MSPPPLPAPYCSFARSPAPQVASLCPRPSWHPLHCSFPQNLDEKGSSEAGHLSHAFLQLPRPALQESPWTSLPGRQLQARPCKQGSMFVCKPSTHQSSSSKVQLLRGLLPSEASGFVSVVASPVLSLHLSGTCNYNKVQEPWRLHEELFLTRRSGEPMNFASLNAALLQRAHNSPRKPCWAGANP